MLALGESIIFVPAVALLALWVWSLVIILSAPPERWHVAGLNQWMWLGVVVFLPLVGSLLFLAIGRKQLLATGVLDPREEAS